MSDSNESNPEPNPTPSLREKLNNHPVMAAAGAVVLLATALTATGTVSNWWDAGHTSQGELDSHIAEAHPAALIAVADAKKESDCANLDLTILIVEQQIWEMEKANDQSQRLVEKRRELKRLEDKRTSLGCSSL